MIRPPPGRASPVRLPFDVLELFVWDSTRDAVQFFMQTVQNEAQEFLCILLIVPRKNGELGRHRAFKHCRVDDLPGALLLLDDQFCETLRKWRPLACLFHNLQMVPIHEVLHEGVCMEETLQAGIHVAGVAQVAEATQTIGVLRGAHANATAWPTTYAFVGSDSLRAELPKLGCWDR
jgi:hypothetical protein